MTPADDALPRRQQFPVDAQYVDNLYALTRDLNDIENLAASALAGDPVDKETARRLGQVTTGLGYRELTEQNRQRREIEAWTETDLADLLDPTALAQLDAWRQSQRFPWERGDLVVVGVAGLVGAVAILFDSQIDSTVLDGLSWLKKSELLHQWEKDAARLPIDYTGPNFGGPAHRVRSAGHDIGRFFNALNQIRDGTFEGVRWEDGQKVVEHVTTTRSGRPFAQVSEPHLAVALLLKHWAADFVTPMSLPLPGWTLLYEMPDRDLRKFAHDAYVGAEPREGLSLQKFAYDAYAGTNAGDGLNLRSGLLTPGLGMVASDVIVRTHSHLAAYRGTGSPRLSIAGRAKRTEMLLAAHAVAGAVSLSKTVAAATAGEGLLAARFLNLPVLLQVGRLALQLRSDSLARAEAGVPTWTQLLEQEAATWTLPEAIALADLFQNPPTTIPPDVHVE